MDNTVDVSGFRCGLDSFPRSGNSFLRKLVEQIIGVPTGNEVKIDPHLTMSGLMGEGHAANDRVVLTKSHHPLCWRTYKDDPFIAQCTVNKQLLLMRNPIDNFISFTIFH